MSAFAGGVREDAKKNNRENINYWQLLGTTKFISVDMILFTPLPGISNGTQPKATKNESHMKLWFIACDRMEKARKESNPIQTNNFL